MKKKGILIGIIIGVAILFVGIFSYNIINSDVRKAKSNAAKYLNEFYTIDDCNKYGEVIRFKELNFIYENLEQYCTEDFMSELLNNRYILLPYERAHIIQATTRIKDLQMNIKNDYVDEKEIIFDISGIYESVLLKDSSIEELKFKGEIVMKKINEHWKVDYCRGPMDVKNFYEPIFKHVQEEYGD